MGRRSINTTKSGKYMNPTDQARKEARKKELKKNKKQRQMVRAAVLKGKDPAQLIEEMEKIDEMEYNVLQPSPLNEKVLREKRKKLKETFDRVMRLYHNDDHDLWSELKRKEVEYERRRSKRLQYFESVRTAQTVQIEDIPLPDMCEKPPAAAPQSQLSFGSVPMPPSFPSQIPPGGVPIPASIQNAIAAHQKAVAEEKAAAAAAVAAAKAAAAAATAAVAASESKRKEPPGCPPGVPPNLLEMRDLDSDYESDDSDRGRKSPKRYKSFRRYSSDRSSSRSDDSESENDVPKPTSVQQRMLAIAGQKYDDFMKELENAHSQSDDRQSSSKLSERRRSDGDSRSNDDSRGDEPKRSTNEPNANNIQQEKTQDEDKNGEQKLMRKDNPAAITNLSAVPAPPMPPPMLHKMPRPPPPPMGMPQIMFRPPPIRPGLQALGMRMPPCAPNMMPRFRMPPGPPPGAPPNRLMHPHHNKFGPQYPQQQPQQQQQHQQQNMMQQPPKDTKGMTTITAKPQIRNLSADVTRFVPTALRVKREYKKIPKPKPYLSEFSRQQQSETAANKGTTKDDAYMQFMREMQGLL